ncbi:hypothetical protein OAS39_08455 [Pirellulales bacterium]|nr:hypothetical protein [Pirellulales bacterium]
MTYTTCIGDWQKGHFADSSGGFVSPAMKSPSRRQLFMEVEVALQ